MSAEWGLLRVQANHIHRIGGGPQLAKYLRVGASMPPGRVARLLAKFWKLPRPSVVLSVTGSASRINLSHAQYCPLRSTAPNAVPPLTQERLAHQPLAFDRGGGQECAAGGRLPWGPRGDKPRTNDPS